MRPASRNDCLPGAEASALPGIVVPWLTGWMIQKTGSFDMPIKAVGVWLALGIASYLFLVRRRFAPK